MASFKLQSKPKPLSTYMRRLLHRLPIACAIALKDTAYAARVAAQKQARQSFKFSGPSTQKFVERGIKSTRRVKTIDLKAEVYVESKGKWGLDFIPIHQTGGARRYRGTMIPVPQENVQEKRSSRGRVRKTLTPKGIMTKKRRGAKVGFVVRRGGTTFMFETLKGKAKRRRKKQGPPRTSKRRKQKRTKDKRNNRIVLRYVFKKKAQFEKRYAFYETTKASAKRAWPSLIRREIRKTWMKISL